MFSISEEYIFIKLESLPADGKTHSNIHQTLIKFF